MKKTVLKIFIISFLLLGVVIVTLCVNFMAKAHLSCVDVLDIITALSAKKSEYAPSEPIIVEGHAVIENIEISGDDIGVLVKEGANVTLKNVYIHDSVKGVYIERGARVVIVDSVIENNTEEGVDVREFAKVVVINNVIRNNGESGIEMESEEVYAIIVNNQITYNEAKGIAVQYREGRGGKAYILSNNIQNNEEYNLYCVNIGGKVKTPKLFFCKYISFYGDIENIKGCKWTQCKR